MKPCAFPFGIGYCPRRSGGYAQQAWANLDTSRFAHQGQNHWLARDGGKRLFQWSNTYVRDGNGQIEWIVGTGIDVTERETTQRRLHSTLERYQNLVECANDAILLVDAETGEILEANPDRKSTRLNSSHRCISY